MYTPNQPNPDTESASKGLIMVVEDALWLLEGLQSALEQAHYEVITAENGEQGLYALDACSRVPDLIITDIMMPRMDGWELALEIRKHPTGTRIPILFLTALDGPTSQDCANQFGAADKLTKPFKAEYLFDAMADLLKRSRESN